MSTAPKLLVAAIIAAATSSAAVAQDAPECMPNAIPGVALVSRYAGRCTQAVFDGADHTRECANYVLSSQFENGRTGFVFQMGARQVAFVGTGLKGGADVFTLDVDQIGAGKGASLGELGDRGGPARGTCKLDNSDETAPKLSCTVKANGKESRFVLVASGEPQTLRKCESAVSAR